MQRRKAGGRRSRSCEPERWISHPKARVRLTHHKLKFRLPLQDGGRVAVGVRADDGLHGGMESVCGAYGGGGADEFDECVFGGRGWGGAMVGARGGRC